MSTYPYTKKILLPILIILSISLIIYDITHPKKTNTHSQQQLHILATTSIIADVLQHLVQDVHNQQGQPRVIIHTLMKIGVDPHEYETTLQDAIHCNNANIIVISGLNLERTTTHIFNNLKQLKPVYTATQNLQKKHIIKDKNFSAGIDPHFWGDVRLMSLAVNHLLNKLQQIDPQHAQHYAYNAKTYQKQLKELHTHIIKKINQLPKEKRIVVTTHDFLSYFANAYHIQVLSLQGFSTAREITLKRRKELANIIIKKKIKTIFVETGINNRGIKSLVETCKLQGHKVSISPHPLYADSTGPKNSPAGSYIGMMRHNTKIIITSLT